MNLLNKLKIYLRRIGFHNTIVWKFLKIFVADIFLFKVLYKLKRKESSNDVFKILVINHFFDGEIEVLRNQLNVEDVSMEYIYPEPSFTRAFVWFPLDIQNAHIPYDSEIIESVRVEFKKYCEKFFLRLRKSYKFDCIVTPSDSFFWLREFIAVAERYGVLTIVADKEGVISPYDFLTAPLRIREFYPPISKYFFVWSERQKSFWINSGVPEENIKIVGSIRTDSFINLFESHSKNSVLYFDFDSDAYINIFDWNFLRWSGERTWEKLRESFHKVIYNLAIKNPNLIFYIKCHPQQINSSFPEMLLSLDNVKIIKGAPKGIPSLLNQSILVLGFQTTALLEASLARIPVVYGAWGGLFDAIKEYLLPWHEFGYGFKWARSETDLETFALEYINGNYLNQENRTRLSEYFFDANGSIANRFLKEVKATIKKDINVI